MLIAWLLLSVLIGFLSSKKDLGFLAGFFISLLASPLVGFIIYIVSKDAAAPVNPDIEALKAEIEALKNQNAK